MKFNSFRVLIFCTNQKIYKSCLNFNRKLTCLYGCKLFTFILLFIVLHFLTEFA